MKRKYCYVSHCGDIKAGEKVFRIFIGDSPREQVKKNLIDQYACSHGAYFRLWDGDTDFELMLRSRSNAADSNCRPFGFDWIDIEVKDFYDHLISGSLDMVELPSYVVKNMFRISSILSPSFYFNHSREARIRPARTVPRKYLSENSHVDNYGIAAAVGLILALFTFVAWLDGIEPIILGY